MAEEPNEQEKQQPKSSLLTLSKTERRRLAKQQRKNKINGTTTISNEEDKKEVQKKKKKVKKKKILTKEERRDKYTKLAREKRAMKLQRKQNSDAICFHCRQKGHSISSCPAIITSNNNTATQTTHTGICYQCGSTEHRLKNCPYQSKKKSKKQQGQEEEEEGALPFATCFVCYQVGHIASQCTQNTHGIYVTGEGGCKLCGSIQHLAIHCPNTKRKEEKEAENDVAAVQSYMSDEDEDHFLSNATTTGRTKQHNNQKSKIVRF